MSTNIITKPGVLSNGQNVSTTTTFPVEAQDGVIELDHTIDIGAQNSTQINIGLVLDTSGSTTGLSGSDVDGDGVEDTFLEAQIIAAKALFQTYIDLGYDPSRVNITLIEYYSIGQPVGQFNLSQQGAFETALDNLVPGGSTNFADPLSDLYTEWTNQGVSSNDSNSVVFLSDGLQNTGGDFSDEAQDLIDDFGANISGIGVGTNASLTSGVNGGLNDLDNTGGATIVEDVQGLIDEVNSPPPNVDVDSVTITYSYPDPADPTQTLTVQNTYVVGAPGSPLTPTPSGYALNDVLIDLDPDPVDGTTIQVEVVTSFDNGETTITTEEIGVLAVVCFTAGTLIATATGDMPAIGLRLGDMVQTKDHGLQPIRWIGHRKVSARAQQQNPKLRPVRIRAGSLGQGLPERDLLVSRQHRILLRSKLAYEMFGVREVLIAASRLTALPGIEIVQGGDDVTYVHFLCDRHEIVYAENMPAESLFVGIQARNMIPHEQLVEISTLFPHLFSEDDETPFARPVPKNALQQRVVARFARDLAKQK